MRGASIIELNYDMFYGSNYLHRIKMRETVHKKWKMGV
jgi:hypothetical protein